MWLYLAISCLLIPHGMAGINCPSSSWILYHGGNTCLLKTASYGGYTTGVDYCNDFAGGADIVQVKDEAKDAFIKAQANFISTPFWLGLRDEDGDGTFQFEDGSSLGSYAPWLGPANPGEECVAWKSSESRISDWEPGNCFLVHNFVCELEAIVTCDPGWTRVRDEFVCFKVILGRKQSYDTARAHCQSMGGDLITKVKASKHRRSVMGAIKFRGHFWIGINDMDGDGVDNYVDGTPVDGNKPFKKGRGLDQTKNHMCASLKSGRWYGKKCARKQFYVCQKDA